MSARVVLAILISAVTAGAQAQAPAPGLGLRPRPGGPPGEASRGELNKMVDAYIVSNLQESIGLSDEQFVRVLPLVKRYQADRRALAERRHQALRQMRELFEAGNATEAQVAGLLKDLRAVETEEPAVLRRNMDALDAQLTVVQQAKLRVLMAQVEQRLRELISRVRQPAGEGAGRQRRLNPPS